MEGKGAGPTSCSSHDACINKADEIAVFEVSY